LIQEPKLRDWAQAAESMRADQPLDAAALAKIKPIMVIRGQVLADPVTGEIGGAGRQALKLSKALKDLGVQVKIVSVQIGRRQTSQRKIEGVPVDELNVLWWLFERKGLRALGVYVYMFRLVLYILRHSNQFNIIHVHSALTGAFVSVLFGKWLGKRVITKVMNSGYLNDLKLFKTLPRIIGSSQMAEQIKRSDRIIALNHLAAAELQEMGFSPKQIAQIPNGVEVQDIQPKADYAISGPARLIFVGRFHECKGIDRLFHAIKLIQQEQSHKRLNLTLLGTGSLDTELERLAQELGIASSVHFQGQVTDVIPFLQESDIFVLPSKAEGISNALLEAMACGLPCVTTNNAGNRFVISSGENGLLVPVDDDTALAEAILQCISDQQLRELLGRNARMTVELHYSIESVAKRYVQLYHQMLLED
jgi:glycosyltransferase involved in cell wall biosynthesis